MVTVLIRVTSVERTATRTLLEMYGHEREPTARNVGTPIPAVDGSTSETFTYSIEDTYAGSMFQIDASSGQLKTKPGQLYNYEPDDEYGLLVPVRVADSDGVSNLILVTVNLTDRDEPPRKIVGPCSTEQTATSLTVEWGTGHFFGYPQTKSYDLRYRRGKTATTNRGRWTNGEQGVPRARPQSTISGLEPDTYYEVAIRGTNDEGTGDWSTSNCSTRFNTTDEAATSPSRSNSPATGGPGISGSPLVGETLTATTSGIQDEDGLTDADFAYQWIRSELGSNSETDIAGATGSSYAVTSDDEGKAIKVRVAFTDDAGNEESLTSFGVIAAPASSDAQVPDPPGTPDVSPQESGSLAVSWTGPASDGGSAITGYRVQWKEAADSWDTAADVSDASATGTSHTITGLTGGTEYSVRVLAINDIGEGLPSDDGSGTPRETVPPELSAASVDGATLTLTFNEAVDANSEPASTAFTVTVGGNVSAVDSVDVTGSAVTLTLASAVTPQDTVTVSYTVPASESAERLRDAVGNAAASFADRSVTNETASAAPLTASVHDAPESHNGTDAFTFELLFSETPRRGFSYKTLRDHAFTVTGGEVVKARRLEPGKNVRWEITVRPDSNNAVTIVLPVTDDCDADGAICTENDRMLSERVELTVTGPEG